MNTSTGLTPDVLLAEAAWLHRLARAMLRDPERAHDVAQATLVAALERGSTQRVGELRAWLHAVARRLAGRAARDERRRMARERAVARSAGDDGGAGTAARLELHRRLCEAVVALPEPYRTAVSLRFFDDLPPRTIAARVGATAAVVRQRVHRGLALLRERFDAADAGGVARMRGDGWRSAFAAAGLGAGARSFPGLILLTIVMHKTWLAAAVLVAAAVWWFVPAFAPADAARPVAAARDASLPLAPDPASRAEPPERALERAAVVAALVVRVVDAATERPIGGALVQRWDADGELVSGTTAADGSVAFAPLPGSGGVLVRGCGLAPLVRPLAVLHGDLTVRCAPGARVCGRVLVDGEPAPAGLALELTLPGAGADVDEFAVAVPAVVRDLLRRLAGKAETVTDARGDFVFSGLASDWAGEIVVPRTHWLLPRPDQCVDGDRLLLTAPREGLRVETTQLPAVRGRVEWSDGGEPVAKAYVILQETEFADGMPMSFRMVVADDRGRFVLPLAPDAPNERARWLVPQQRSEPVRVRVSAQSGTMAHRTLEQGGGPLDLRTDVVLRLERPVVRRFRALDPDGHPLAGVRAIEHTGGLGAPTGADGLGTSTNTNCLSVGAPGRQLVALPLHGSGDRPPDRSDELRRAVVGDPEHAPIDLVLPAGSTLLVRVRTGGGEPARAHAVALRSRVRVDRSAVANLHRRFGGAAFAGVRDAFLLEHDGTAKLSSLRPDEPGRLVVFDAFDRELGAQDVVTPPPGEDRAVDVTVAEPPRTLRGRVVDGNGAPVALARLALRVPGPSNGLDRGVDLRAGADGRFRYGPFLIAGDLVVTAHRPGFGAATRALTGADFDTDVQLVLPLARRATVRIVDERGAPMPDLLLVVETGTPRRVDQQRTAPGEFVCSDLPDRDVTVATSFAGRWYRAPLPATTDRVELRVPCPARVRIDPPNAWPRDPFWQLMALATPLSPPTGDVAEPVLLETEGGSQAPYVVNQLLLPGRYRLELVATRWDGSKHERRLEGPAAEVELRAGDDVRVTLR
ncbi:MAG TPA: sigma-70 family RNA polymerase sigma factor [Planctomycetota bacterium]